MAEFTINALTAANGLLALTPMPGRDGDYHGDLERVKNWKPDLVISMTPGVELASAGMHHLPQDLQEIASWWLYLPVPDYGVPEESVSAEWDAVSARAQDVLRSGGRILVHCRGGCGRSGMMVLRLMIEMGEPVQAALKRLRLTRPCAVETEDQLRWACDVA